MFEHLLCDRHCARGSHTVLTTALFTCPQWGNAGSGRLKESIKTTHCGSATFKSRYPNFQVQFSIFFMLLSRALQTVSGFPYPQLNWNFLTPNPQDLHQPHIEGKHSFTPHLQSIKNLSSWQETLSITKCQRPPASLGAEAALGAGLCEKGPQDQPPSAASRNKIVVPVTRQLTWLRLLVLDCFWRVSNSMIFTCHWLKGGIKSKSETL